MSGFKTFAVLGGLGGDSPFSAGVGFHITKALAQNGATVTALAREGSQNKATAEELKKLGASVAVVDYAKPDSLARAFEGIDVVVSALGGLAIANQLPAVDAASKAGVKLFVTSEFGSARPETIEAGSFLTAKEDTIQKLKTVGLPWTGLVTGLFAEYASFAWDGKDNHLDVVGDLSQPQGATSFVDAAVWLAHVLTHVKPSKYQNRLLRIQATKKPISELVEVAKRRNPSLKVEHRTQEWAAEQYRQTHDFVLYLKELWSRGYGTAGEPLDNALAPSVTLRPLEEFWN